MDTEQSSRNEVDLGFQAWCEGRLHGIPAERRATKVSLFLTTFLAPHRVKASATLDQNFDPSHPRSRGDDRRRGGPFCRPLAREGGWPTKIPFVPGKPIRSPSPGQAGKGRRFLPARLRAGPGLPRLGPPGPRRVNSAVASGVDRRARAAGPCRERGHNVYGKSSLAQTSGSASAAL